MAPDHNDNFSSSGDDELLAGLPVRNIHETRAHSMRMIARVGESLKRVKAVSVSPFAFTPGSLSPSLLGF